MDGARIDRWRARHRLALESICIAQATLITAPATAAQNEPEEVPGRFFNAHAALEF